MENPVSESPQLIVAGRFLTGQEEKRWQRTLRDPVSRVLLFVIGGLFLFFSLQAAVLATQSDWMVPTFVFPLIAGSGWFLVSWIFRARSRIRRACEQTVVDRWQDEKAVRAGCMISFYNDHAAYSTLRGSSLMPYNEVTVYRETPDGILFGNSHFRIVLRSYDLTSAQLSAVRHFLRGVLPASVYRIQEPAISLSEMPLPHVRFANFDTVVARAELPAQKNKREQRELEGFVIPQALVYGVVPALMTKLTPNPLLNCVMFCLLFVVISVAATRLLYRMVSAREACPLQIVFTKEGLACRQHDVVSFTVRNRFRWFEGPDGVTIWFSGGDRLEIPWSAIDDPEALRREIVEPKV